MARRDIARHMTAIALPPIALALVLGGCSEPEEIEPLQGCVDAAAGRPVPRTVEEAVDHLNALPMPLTMPCALASFPRPFEAVATLSQFSAQPASGSKSPRLFLILGELELSVVPVGEGAPLLEFGEWVAPRHTVKAELEMPLAAPVDDAEPFRQVLYQAGDFPFTNCGLCHAEESVDREVLGVNAYRSQALRPHHNLVVSLADAIAENERCKADLTLQEVVDDERCGMLHAIFDFGLVEQGEFSEDLDTLGD